MAATKGRGKGNPKPKTPKPERLPGRRRGVTPAQYHALFRMVRAGETTWDELERRGIVLPSARESAFRRTVKERLGK